MKLTDMKPGQRAVVTSLANESDMRRRLQDLGLIQGTVVECVGRSPLGDPTAYLIRKAVVALRRKDAERVSIEGICG